MERPLWLQFDIAILWLQNNEGEIEENTACKVVADWLINEVENMRLKQAAKEGGVSVVKLRKRLKQYQKEKQNNLK